MYAILSRLPILQGMNGRDLAMIQEMASEVHYTAQAHPKPFIHAHTICNMLYFLAVGSLVRRITSPDGRILGKMGHSERFAPGLFRNIAGDKDQKIFLSGVSYFK